MGGPIARLLIRATSFNRRLAAKESRRELIGGEARVDQLFQPAAHAVLLNVSLALGRRGLQKPYQSSARNLPLFAVQPCLCAIPAHPKHRSRLGTISVASQQADR